MIPRVVHQVWLGATEAEPPARLAEAAATWRAAHPSWEYRCWNGDEVEALFTRARPDLLELYRRYPYWVQRADAARYLILYEHGGVYSDFDVACVRAVDPFLEAEVVLAPTEPLGVSNDLMMARPAHPLFRAALDELPRSFAAWHRPWIPPHFRVICGTGSLHLTRVVRRRRTEPGLRLLTAAEYGHGDEALAVVRHLPGNSWAGWDTHALLFLERHWKALLAGVAALAAAWVVAR